MKEKLTIGFSTCPNDTFIFDAIVNGKIECDFDFEVLLGDVQELNELAFQGKLDITKLSYKAFAFVSDQYQLLNSGSALGRNCGPLVITRSDSSLTIEDLAEATIATPGRYTTADLLLSYACPNANRREELLFSQIEDAVINGDVDAGLIIHENRFTYQDKGLKKLIDLGEHWENGTGNMIPLGGIAIKRALPEEVKKAVDRLISSSVEYAWNNPKEVMDYVGLHAQEMSRDVMQKHIDLYVNEYSVDLGEAGRAAVKHLYQKAALQEGFPSIVEPVFVG
ncbi:MAG: 1,4-dihydroxy-6-naphthoate synthase [Oceanospirillaceae bacterium]